MSTLYSYSEGSLLFSSSYKVISFYRDSSISQNVEIEVDGNLRVLNLRYKDGALYSEIPSAYCKVIEDSEITYTGDLYLKPSHTINGLTFYLKGDYPSYLFSCFIDAQCSELEWSDAEVGGYLRIPSVYSDMKDFDDQVLEKINSSKFFYAEGTLKPANILGVDLKEREVKEEWDNDIPYGEYPRLYLNEAEIISAFIKRCREEFPEIEWFPQSSERKNLGKETIFYQARLLADRSIRFNSTVLYEDQRGRWYQTTIPLVLNYQTSDIAQFSNRRSKYLLSHFLMDIHEFEVVKSRGYSDRFGVDKECFTFSTYWERDIADDLVKADAVDGSGRDTFTMTIQCDLICSVFEKSEEQVPIQDIIMNLYFGETNVRTEYYSN